MSSKLDELNDEELNMIIHSVFSRYNQLWSFKSAAHQKTYKHPDGSKPTEQQLKELDTKINKYVSLLDKLRKMR